MKAHWGNPGGTLNQFTQIICYMSWHECNLESHFSTLTFLNPQLTWCKQLWVRALFDQWQPLLKKNVTFVKSEVKWEFIVKPYLDWRIYDTQFISLLLPPYVPVTPPMHAWEEWGNAHWALKKMTNILQMTLFSKKMYVFWLEFHCNLWLRDQLRISQYWFI